MMSHAKIIRSKKFRLLILVITVMCVCWFLFIDWVWLIEGCEDCGYQRFVLQYRVYGVPVSQRVIEYRTSLQEVAEDLGVPCAHLASYRYLKQRWWGLAVPRNQGIAGTVRIAVDESPYNSEQREIVRAMARDNPGVAREFYQKVMVERDRTYWDRFWDSIADTQPSSCINNRSERRLRLVNGETTIELLGSGGAFTINYGCVRQSCEDTSLCWCAMPAHSVITF